MAPSQNKKELCTADPGLKALNGRERTSVNLGQEQRRLQQQVKVDVSYPEAKWPTPMWESLVWSFQPKMAVSRHSTYTQFFRPFLAHQPDFTTWTIALFLLCFLHPSPNRGRHRSRPIVYNCTTTAPTRWRLFCARLVKEWDSLGRQTIKKEQKDKKNGPKAGRILNHEGGTQWKLMREKGQGTTNERMRIRRRPPPVTGPVSQSTNPHLTVLLGKANQKKGPLRRSDAIKWYVVVITSPTIWATDYYPTQPDPVGAPVRTDHRS